MFASGIFWNDPLFACLCSHAFAAATDLPPWGCPENIVKYYREVVADVSMQEQEPALPLSTAILLKF
jgi:hypothetical protein